MYPLCSDVRMSGRPTLKEKSSQSVHLLVLVVSFGWGVNFGASSVEFCDERFFSKGRHYQCVTSATGGVLLILVCEPHWFDCSHRRARMRQSEKSTRNSRAYIYIIII